MIFGLVKSHHSPAQIACQDTSKLRSPNERGRPKWIATINFFRNQAKVALDLKVCYDVGINDYQGRPSFLNLRSSSSVINTPFSAISSRLLRIRSSKTSVSRCSPLSTLTIASLFILRLFF